MYVVILKIYSYQSYNEMLEYSNQGRFVKAKYSKDVQEIILCLKEWNKSKKEQKTIRGDNNKTKNIDM